MIPDSSNTPKPDMDFSKQLESLVIFNKEAQVDAEGPDWVRMKVKLVLNKASLFMARFTTVRDYRRYVLSGYSYTLFQKVRQNPVTVRELIYFLADKEKLSFFESRALIVSFVGMLMKRGLCVVRLPAPDAEDV